MPYNVQLTTSAEQVHFFTSLAPALHPDEILILIVVKLRGAGLVNGTSQCVYIRTYVYALLRYMYIYEPSLFRL